MIYYNKYYNKFGKFYVDNTLCFLWLTEYGHCIEFSIHQFENVYLVIQYACTSPYDAMGP